jgi:outer membrane protein insertion porin family
MTLLLRVVRRVGVAAVVAGIGVVGGGVSNSLLTTPAFAQASSIVVQGNRRVEADTVRSYFRLNPGERLDATKIDEAYKALLNTGLFEDIKISQAGGRITVTVVESAVINRVQFEGNRSVKDEVLVTEIQSKARGSLSRQLVRADVQRLVDVYRANGRYDVRVEPKVIDLPNGRVDLVYEITEGRKMPVRNLRFVGNRAYSDRRLKDAIKTSEAGILSFFKSSDIFDQDRLEADKDLLRRFYLRNGYADVRIVSAVGEYLPEERGFNVTFMIEEGEQYRFGLVDVQSNVREVDPIALRRKARPAPGSIYNAELIEKSVEDMSIEMAKRGYPFAQIRPRGDRNYETRLIDVVFVADQGPRAYIERLNVRGNTRTRDYVIRREFDIAEGDAYNHALVDRAERRLKNLGFFKTAKVSSEPGSAPDRVILNVDVEEQSTGEFSVAGGYSTTDGFMGEVSVAERNLLGRGQYAKASLQYGQRARGFELSFVEPYFLDYRLAFGADVFARVQLASAYQSYETRTYGGGFRFGIPVAEDVSLQARYSIYQREITLPGFNNCYPLQITDPNAADYCIPAAPSIRAAANAGATITSLVGYTLAYNTLDNNKSPTKGFLGELKQDFAGVGGDVNFIRTTADARVYTNPIWDLIGFFRVQGGHIAPWGGQELRMLDHFFMGPNLVRGFQIAGIGPRDATVGSTQDALGGTMYWGATAEVQHPLPFASKDIGVKLAAFADAGSLWNYRGLTSYQGPHDLIPQTIAPTSNEMLIRSSVGVGLIWDSPFGPLRFDYAIPLSSYKGNCDATGACYGGDRIQQFRFSGGTKF